MTGNHTDEITEWLKDTQQSIDYAFDQADNHNLEREDTGTAYNKMNELFEYSPTAAAIDTAVIFLDAGIDPEQAGTESYLLHGNPEIVQ